MAGGPPAPHNWEVQPRLLQLRVIWKAGKYTDFFNQSVWIFGSARSSRKANIRPSSQSLSRALNLHHSGSGLSSLRSLLGRYQVLTRLAVDRLKPWLTHILCL